MVVPFSKLLHFLLFSEHPSSHLPTGSALTDTSKVSFSLGPANPLGYCPNFLLPSGSEITSMWPTPASCISSVPSSPTPFSLASTVAFLLELPSQRFSSNSAASSQPSLSPAHHRIDKRSLSQTLNCTC